MDRQITISRVELGLAPLALQDPAGGFYVSDEWYPGGILWQKYTAAGSALVNGDRVIAQRQISVDEMFTIYVHGDTPAAAKTRVKTLVTALSQFRYGFTVEWDGASYVYTANGAGEIRPAGGNIDPALHRAGWHALEITIPRNPGLG